MGLLKRVVYLTETQKQTLFSAGTITVNISGQDITIDHSDDDIYIIPQSWNSDGSSSDYFYLKDITGVPRLTLSNSGVLSAASFVGSGALLTDLPGQIYKGDQVIDIDINTSERYSIVTISPLQFQGQLDLRGVEDNPIRLSGSRTTETLFSISILCNKPVYMVPSGIQTNIPLGFYGVIGKKGNSFVGIFDFQTEIVSGIIFPNGLKLLEVEDM